MEHLAEVIPIAYFEGKPLESKEKIIQLIDKLKGDFEMKYGITWGLFLHGKLIGSCGYYRGFENEIGEIGYVLNSNYHGKGFMLEAAKAIVDFGFNVLELENISAFTDIENKPSVALLQRMNFINTTEKHKHYTKFLKGKEE